MAKHIHILCPNCRRDSRIRPEHLGRRVACKNCCYQFRAHDYVPVACPDCRSDLDVRREYLGRKIACRHCRHEFTARVPDGPTGDGDRIEAPRHHADEADAIEAGPLDGRAAPDQLRAEPEEARAERARLGAELQALRSEADAARAGLDAIGAERDALRVALVEERSGYESDLAERERLRRLLDDADGRIAALEAERAEAQASARGEAELAGPRESLDAERRALLAEREAGDRARDEQAEQDRLAVAREPLVRDLEALRAEAEDLRAGLAEATGGRNAALAERDRSRDEALALEAELRAIRERWGRERADLERESDRLLGEERARWAGQIDAIRREAGQELASFRDRAEALAREADEVRRGRDEATGRAEALAREARVLSERLDTAEAARAEGERLARALDVARQSEAAAIRRAEDLAERARAAEEERDRERAARAQEHQAARARPEVHVGPVAAPGSRPAEADSRLRAATERADRLEAELRAAMAQVASLSRDLALAHLYVDEEDRGEPSRAGDESLAAAQSRIELLSQQLRAANRKNEELVGSMKRMGIDIG